MNSSDAFIREAQAVEAKWHLDRLRENLTLHAHSQGAIIAVVAQSRLGDFRRVDGGAMMPVAGQIKLATYGGGANMHDWGTTKWFKSYTHHVNQYDMIADLVGMLDPFQQGAVGLLVRTPLGALGGGHSVRVIQGADTNLVKAWLEHHRVVLHPSKAWYPNPVEHNMVEGYICNADQDEADWIDIPLSNKYFGPLRCNDQPPPPGGK